MQAYNMVKSKRGKLHAFLGIIKLLASLEGAEKHLKKISLIAINFFLLVRLQTHFGILVVHGFLVKIQRSAYNTSSDLVLSFLWKHL